MRSLVVTAALIAALPVFSQQTPGAWCFDVHSVSPTLTGHYNGTQNGQAVDFDLVRDLGLARSGSRPVGAGLEYQGPRFGVEASVDTQNYQGSGVLTRDVTISGTTYRAMATLDTKVKMTNYSFNWTIRILRAPGFWLGVDLGVLGTTLDLNAVGSDYLLAQAVPASFKAPLPMPQVGPAAGYTTLNGRLALRAYYHFLDYKGANYTHTGGDLRYFPWSWLGLRVFTSTESWKVPQGSIASDLDIALDRSGTGFGLVARF